MLEHKKVAVPYRNLSLDLGCGKHRQVDYIGIDNKLDTGAQVIWDLEKGIPFDDGTIGRVWASHFLEHIKDPKFLINEIHRVCCHNAHICIKIPLNLRPFGLPDPSHKVEFTKDWVGEYIDPSKFTIIKYQIDEIHTVSSNPATAGQEFSYEQATLELRVKKVK